MWDGAALQGEGFAGSPVLMGEVHRALLPFPLASSVHDAVLIWARCLCSFQAKMGFLAFVSAVKQSLCRAEAVSPLAKRQEGHSQGLKKVCLEDRRSPCVLNLR